MRKLPVNVAQDGMSLALPIYNSDGVPLVQKGNKLDRKIIHKLMSYGVKEVYVEDEDFSSEVIMDIVSQQVRVEAIKTLKDWIFNYNGNKLIKSVGNSSLDTLIEKILGELTENPEKCVKFLDIRTLDNFTYAHSVNVCILSLITGISLGYSAEELYILGLAALLHDVGKSLLPTEIVNNDREFSDYQLAIMQKHPLLGYQLLLEDSKLNPIIAEIVYQHHERFDGSGYPRHLRADNILKSANIIGVADVFDALTNNRQYRKKYLPHEAMEYLYGAGNHLFDYEVIQAFVQLVALYPIGTTVLLSNGEEGIVVEIDPKISARPKVRIIKKSNGQRPISKKVINLGEQPTIMITKVISGGL